MLEARAGSNQFNYSNSRMTMTNLQQKFTQTYPASTIYWHTCKFTGESFCSQSRRETYSPKGWILKAEHKAAIDEAKKHVCKVYFYQCPETGVWFTTRNVGSRWSEEGKKIVRERQRLVSKEYRQTEVGKEKDRARMQRQDRVEYAKEYRVVNKEKLSAKAKERYIKAKKRYVKPVRLSCPVYFVTCPETGLLFASKSKTRRLSDEGQLIVNRRNALLREQQNHVAPELECKQCKGAFWPTYGDKRRCYCSDECADKAKLAVSKKLNKYHRRARHYGVAFVRFDIHKVFERDKWTCQLCGVPTPKLKRGSYDDDAPELDHVVAMSKGGPHTPDNTQCLCRKCNREKGVKAIGQQRLFA